MCDGSSLLSLIADIELLRGQYRETMPPFECLSTGNAGTPDRSYSQGSEGNAADRWVWELCKNNNQQSWRWIISGEWGRQACKYDSRVFCFEIKWVNVLYINKDTIDWDFTKCVFTSVLFSVLFCCSSMLLWYKEDHERAIYKKYMFPFKTTFFIKLSFISLLMFLFSGISFFLLSSQT